MASVQVYDSVKTALQDGFTPMPVLDFDRVDPDRQQGTDTFLVLEEGASAEDLIGFGGVLCNREAGVLEVHVLVPAPNASEAARTQANAIQDYLRNQVFSNGLVIVSVSPPAPGSANNGLWTVYSIAIAYEFDSVYAHPVAVA